MRHLLCALLLTCATSVMAESAPPPAVPVESVGGQPATSGNNAGVSGPAFQPAPVATQRPGNGAATVGNPWSMVLGLLFLLALVVGAWWLVRRLGGLPGAGNRGLRVLASLPVGARERVVIADIGGEQWALGVAPGRVTLLHRFETPVITSGGQGDDFAARMRQLLQQGLNR
jgi:flagellar protein FliO/FliZ